MQRRRFLQLAASVAAGAVAPQAPAFSAPSLRLAHVLPAAGIGSAGTVIALVGDPVFTRFALAALSSAATEPVEFRTGRERLGIAPAPADVLIEMLWERRFDSPGGGYQWLINGRPYAESEPVRLLFGQRCRLRMMNATGEVHAIHLQQHCFQVTRFEQAAVCGTFRNAIRLERYSVVDADVVVGRASRKVSVFEG